MFFMSPVTAKSTRPRNHVYDTIFFVEAHFCSETRPLLKLNA